MCGAHSSRWAQISAQGRSLSSHQCAGVAEGGFWKCLTLLRTSASVYLLSSQRSRSLTDPPKEHPKPEGTTSTMRSGTCVPCCPSARRTRSACPTCTPWQQAAPTSGSRFSFRVSPHTSLPLQLPNPKPNPNPFRSCPQTKHPIHM